MSKTEYPGYPQYVIITLPKCGTKTMNKCFTTLGYKVFDVMQVNNHAKELDDYGTKKIEFPELAKIWEDNKYDVIIEPSGLYWLEMANHWPKTKFIQLTRDVESWEASVTGFMKTIIGIPQGAIMDHNLFNNPHISPTAHHALHRAVEPYALYTIGFGPLFLDPAADYDKQEPWSRMIARKYRLFHADVTINAPKDRTLFNYNIKDGWPKLRQFLGLPPNDGDQFPHENKGASAVNFVSNLWVGTEYETKVNTEIAEYMKRNGYEVKKLEPEGK